MKPRSFLCKRKLESRRDRGHRPVQFADNFTDRNQSVLFIPYGSFFPGCGQDKDARRELALLEPGTLEPPASIGSLAARVVFSVVERQAANAIPATGIVTGDELKLGPQEDQSAAT